MTADQDDYTTVPSGAPTNPAAAITVRMRPAVPHAVYRRLTATERGAQIMYFHKHPALIARQMILLAALAACLAAPRPVIVVILAIALIAGARGRTSRGLFLLITGLLAVEIIAWRFRGPGLPWLFLAILAGYQVALWRASWVVITPQRAMVIGGLLIYRIDQLPVARIRDIGLVLTLAGRMLGYGTLDFASIGTEQALNVVTFVPKADQAWLAISQMTMTRPEAPPLPDTDWA